MADMDEGCEPGLFLGLGMGGHVARPDAGRNSVDINKSPAARTTGLDLCFALCPDVTLEKSPTKAPENDCHDDNSSTPSYSSCRPSRNDHANNSRKESGCRKKLRLSKEQSTLLQESFNLHNTLTPAQKQSLAHQLNLIPRQVEVWFQNRRARIKLKQMEVDFAFLKKCCESLRNENRGLKKELQELRSTRDEWKHGHPCPSCCSFCGRNGDWMTLIHLKADFIGGWDAIQRAK